MEVKGGVETTRRMMGMKCEMTKRRLDHHHDDDNEDDMILTYICWKEMRLVARKKMLF